VLRWISVYRHAVVITPVARWVLIARVADHSNRFPFIPSDGGLPHPSARSASTLVASRPAQRTQVTACRLAASPMRHICLEGSDGFVTSTVAPIATG